MIEYHIKHWAWKLRGSLKLPYGGGREIMKKVLSVIFCVVALLLGSGVQAEYYTLVDLGTISPRDINDNNLIVGASSFSWDAKPILWNKGFTTVLSECSGEAVAINKYGQAVGTIVENGSQHGFLFVPGAAIFNIGGAMATDINASGNVSGANNGEAALWQISTGQWESLNAGIGSLATALNDDNTVIGYDADNGGGSFVSKDGVVSVFDQNYQANDINNAGRIVEGITFDNSLRFTDAPYDFIQTKYSYGRFSETMKVNDAGNSVGYFDTGFEGLHALIVEGEFMQDLNMLIDAGLGWKLSIARAMNNKGVIVGEGFNAAGELHGFELLPQSAYPVPEPSSLLLLSLGISSVGFLKSRNRLK